MARNPSRPIPTVKNQFRPVSDWLGYICDPGTCPYDDTHVMKSHRLMRHVIKCEGKNGLSNPEKKEEEKSDSSNIGMERCPFNSLHRFPIGKHDEHFRECKARAADIMARIAAGESLDDIDNRYRFKSPLPKE